MRPQQHEVCANDAGECPELAPSCHDETGRACPLCPGTSDLDLFRYGEGVVDLDTEIAHSALDLRVPE
jgi:hypothetical protein